MPTPTLTFCVPCHPAASDLIQRFLHSLSFQTSKDFDVVLAVDGGDAAGSIKTVAATSKGFTATVVDTPRPIGDYPHRNHARNGAIRAASGEYVWVVDADFLWSPNAVAHAIAAMDEAEVSPEFLALTPILLGIDEPYQVWLAESEPWLTNGKSLQDFLSGQRLSGDVYSGFGEFATHKGMSIRSHGLIPEGFPLLRRDVALAMDLFDERFIAWGGNKEEFCRRLGFMPGLEYKILTSVHAWHQPHAPDERKRGSDPIRRKNQGIFKAKAAEIKADSGWWRKQRSAVQRLKSAEVSTEHESGAIKTLLVRPADHRKGLYEDGEIIIRALKEKLRRNHRDTAVTILPVDVTLDDQKFGKMFSEHDVVIFLETLRPIQMQNAMNGGVRVVYIPNADWACLNDNVPVWASRIITLQQNERFTLLSKSAGFHDAVKAKGIRSKLIPWSSDADIYDFQDRVETEGPVRFYANVGFGGWRDRRGTDIILAAWKLCGFAPEQATLRIKSLVEIDAPDDVVVVLDDWPRSALLIANVNTDVVLYPSRWEGFGLSLSEALNAGTPAIAPDCWPMNEQVVDGVNGILIPAHVDGKTRLAPKAEPDPAELAAAMKQMVDGSPRSMTGSDASRRHATVCGMRMALQDAIWGTAPALVAVLVSDRGPDGRCAEDFWCEALRASGYAVQVIEKESLNAGAGQITGAEFCLVGKPTVLQLDYLRGLVGETPIVSWHHDLVGHTAQRILWQESICQLVDYAFIPEDGCEQYGPNIGTLMPGVKVPRPEKLRAMSRDVVFLGGIKTNDPDRLALVERFNAKVWGDQSWFIHGIEPEGYVPVEKSGEIYNGKLCLCTSRGGHKHFYTSNRLFNVAAGGGLPLMVDFPGRDRLFQDNAVLIIGKDDPETMSLVELEFRRMNAFRAAWSNHGWTDRVYELIKRMNEFKPSERKAPGTIGPLAFQKMWDDRAASWGRKAVGHVAWTEADFQKSTKDWWKMMRRSIGLKGTQNRILDYGCGVGRFTALLDGLAGKEVVGVDISPNMLEMARKSSPNIDFRLLKPGHGLPFPTGSFDMLFTSTVLQHVPEAEFDHVVAELLRVLRPGALVVMFENTHRYKSRTSGSGHVVFRPSSEYESAFQGIQVHETKNIKGEIHSMMAGRLSRR